MNRIRHVWWAVLLVLATVLPAVEPQVVTGSQHALYLADDGTVWAWGSNSSGQLGLGDTTTRLEPVQVPGLTNIIQISAGMYHSMALRADGTVYVWGYDYHGQVGNGTSGTTILSPTASSISNVKQIAAGGYHCLALLTDGTIKGWGYNYYGQVGNGSTMTASPFGLTIPTAVSTSVKFRTVCGGGFHSLAISDDGYVWAWGSNSNGQIGNTGAASSQSSPVQVSVSTGKNAMGLGAGFYHSMAVTANGLCYTWGSDGAGQLGNDSSLTDQLTPVAVSTVSIGAFISSGYRSSALVRANGELWLWGDNASGECRLATSTASYATPQSTGVSVRSCSTGFGNFFVAINGDATVVAWGDNAYGQLGINTTSPSNSASPLIVHATWPVSKPVAVAHGSYHAAAVKSDGTVWSWGNNSYGQLGTGTTTSSAVPVQTSVVTGATMISSGGYNVLHTVARTYQGLLYAWGSDAYGQTGQTATAAAQSTPQSMVGIYWRQAVAGGGYNGGHTIGLYGTGNVYGWGSNGSGQLGNGSTTDSSTVVGVGTANVNNIIQVAAGGFFSVALRADGTVWTWGDDTYGQLGNDSTSAAQSSPVQVSGLTGIVQIVAGTYHALALKSDGSVMGWGYSVNGSNQMTPVTVLAASNGIRSISAGAFDSFAVKSDGNALAWGDSSSGSLGTTTGTVTFTSGAVMVASGYYGSTALAADGGVLSWGSGSNGQIGNGGTASASTPTSTAPNWLPMVSVDAASSSLVASENGPTAGTVRMVRTGSTAGSLTVNYGTSGTATAVSDYTTATSVIIPWGASGANATVMPIDDFVVDPAETVILTELASVSNYSLGSTISGTVTIIDNDTAGITVSPTTLTTTEAGGSASFTIALTSQPTANVTIGLINNDPTEGSLSATSVVLTSSNWDTGVVVTVTGVDDSVDDGDVSYTITTNAAVSSDPNYSGLNAADVTVTNIDNDTAGFEYLAINGNPTEAVGGMTAVAFTSFTGATKTLILPGTVDVSALRIGQALVFLSGTNSGQGTTITSITAGSGGTPHTVVLASSLSGSDLSGGTLSFIPCFGIRLTSQPTADVTLVCSSADTAKMVVSPTSLIFTGTNWNAYQLVSCYGIDNKLDDGDVTLKARFDAATSNDSVYSGMKPSGVAVTVIDDDVSALVVSQASVAVSEGGSAATYTVKLACRPTAAVTVGIANDNTSRVTVDKTSLTFTILNWNVAQTVTVMAVDDPDINGLGSATITHTVSSSSDTNYATAASVTVGISVADNDAPGLILSPLTTSTGRLVVNEGYSVTVGVRLASRPVSGKSVRMKFTLSDNVVVDGHDSLSGADITWGYGDWDTVKYVTITASEDGDFNNETYALDGELVDCDTGSATITLNNEDPSYYTFGGTWSQIQTNLAYLQNRDNDTPGIALTSNISALSEGGGTGTCSVRLMAAPGPGTLVAVSLIGAGVSVSPTMVFFSGDTGGSIDWNVDQTISVVAIDDAIAQGVHSAAVQADIAYSTSAGYPVPVSPATEGSLFTKMAVQITDNDSAGIVVSPTEGLLCTEAGGSSVFTVRLTSQPTGPVRVAFSRSAAVVTVNTSGQTGSGGGGASAYLDFTSADWNSTRTVTISGVDNSTADGDKDFTIAVTVEAANTSDAAYKTIDPADVRGRTIDDDAVGVHLWAASSGTAAVGTLNLTETTSGGSHAATYYVSLASQPSAAVTVNLYSDGQTTVSPATLVFDASTWSSRQAVTVTAVDDAVAESSPHTGTVTASATGGDYTGVAISAVTVSITDNDTAGITVGTVSGPVTESGAMLIGPVATLTGSTAGTVITVNDASGLEVGMWLRITSGGDQGRYGRISAIVGNAVTVAATLATNASVTLAAYRTTITAPSVTGATVVMPASIPLSGLMVGQYLQFTGGANDGRTVQVTAIDGSGHTLTLATSVVTTTDQNLVFFAALSVVLNSQPTASVDVAISTSDGTEASVFPGHITFTPQTWNVAQVLAIQGVDDAVDDGDQTPLVVFSTTTSTDGNYSGKILPNDRAITVLDDDEHGFVLSASSVTVSESAGSATVSVRLASQPTAEVTVALSSGSVGSVAVSPATLTFTPVTWQTAQTVTITGQDSGTDPGAGISATVSLLAGSTDTTYANTQASIGVTVTAANAAPTIDGIANQVATQQNSQIVVPLTGIGSGQAGENQTLTITATASPTTLLGTPVVTYTSPATTGTLTIPLVSGAFGSGTVTVTVTDDAAIGGSARSSQVSFSVTVAAVVVDLNGSDPGVDGVGVTFTEDATGALVASVASLVDSQSRDLASFTATLTTAPDGIAESLTVDVAETGLTQAYDTSTRTLTISGNASASVYQQVVRTLTYHHASQDPTAGVRTLSLSAVDQDGVTSLPATVAVTVVPVNDAPVIGGSGAFSVSGQQSVVIDTSILTVTDVDSPASSLSVTAVTIPGEGTLLLDGTALETGASITLAQISAGKLVYQHTSTTLSNDVFAVRAGDGSATSVLSLVTITVLGNHAPTMTATTVAVAGNHPRTVTLPISDPAGLVVTMVLSSSAPPAKGAVVVGGAGTNRITYTPDLDAVGADAFGLVLTNTNGESATVTVAVHITDPGEDQPIITSHPPIEVVAGERFYYEPAATNPSGGPLIWELDSTPSGAVFGSGTGTINWPSVALPSDGSGYHRLDLVAVDDTHHRVAWQVIWLKVRATAPMVTN